MIKTALYEASASIPERIAELEMLMNHASNVELWLDNGSFKDGYPFIKTKDLSHPSMAIDGQLLLDSLCRSCCILLVSHLEGFIKDVNKAIISDLNENIDMYSSMPESLKRSFCERIAFYDGVPDEERNERAKQLNSYFELNSVPINFSAFRYKESSNKNPTSNFIDNSFVKYGIHGLLNTLSDGFLYDVFENDIHKMFIAKRHTKRDRSLLIQFPYKKFPMEYNFHYINKKKSSSKKSLWHDYIDHILTQRHNIVHGDTTANHSSILHLRKDISKLNILMHGISFSSANYFALNFI
ncbi:HEPN domain-containing protein [Pantoea eucrina]|uniref:HEPN domain-containing protein n=1 Tax=Pantoea eucrina TaxID=472693 RepID=A0ABU5LE35_9GAMM|nr:HEPN domain-containing protein [Pantoea eucrina]MDZ7278195.1 HEPN domain-containing protein [Pantoea eucrina]